MSRRLLSTRRILATASLAGLLAMLGNACASGGESESSPAGGSSGDDGSAGSGATGGSSASGGTSGNGGSSASGGSAGSTGGSAGSSGNGGSAGAAADGGLEDGGGDGSVEGGAGASGTGGGGGSGGCGSNPEVCNGLDDNCNNQVDEGDPGGGGTCTTGKPDECAAGTWTCPTPSEGGTGVLVCIQNNQPAPEMCDGNDNNCNGAVDEGSPGAGMNCDTGQLGICQPGTTVCTGGAIMCVPNVPSPQNEICNGLDDDCDGQADENNPQGGQTCDTGKLGECQAGTTNCNASGQLQCVQNVQPTGEVCNNKDDDCNGSIDEGLNGLTCMTALPGVCALGTTQCVAGSATCNQQVQPSAELCNGLDDNCNGSTDEANPGVMCLAQYPLAGNVAQWSCSGGNCDILACVGGFKNQDGAPGNGCESVTCTTNPSPSTCAGPTASPALTSSNNNYTFTGQLTQQGQIAWWAPSFTAPTPGQPFVPTIQFTLNQSNDYSLEIFYGCSNPATCPAAGSLSGGGGSNVTGDKWQMNFNAHPQACGAPLAACTNASVVPSNIRVKVTRVNVSDPCNQFTLKISQ